MITKDTATKDASAAADAAVWLPIGDADPRLAWGNNIALRDWRFLWYASGDDREHAKFWLTSDATFRQRAVERFGPHHVVWFDIERAMVTRVVEQFADANTADGSDDVAPGVA